MIPLPLIAAGYELIKTISSDNEKENQEKVIEVLAKVAKDLPHTIDTRPFWQTKTFWTMSIGVLVPILNKVFGWYLSIEEVSAMMTPLMIFILTEQWKKKV